MKLIPPRAFWSLFWSGRLSREEKRAILELADERDEATKNVYEMAALAQKYADERDEARSGGQSVGTCRPGCVPNCPGSSQDGNKSASDLLLDWQVGDPIPRP